MNLGIVGTGRMGKTVMRFAEEDGHRIVACCNSSLPPARCLDDLLLCDAVVDFSLPHVVVQHLELYAENRIPAVVGATGWFDQLDYVSNLVEQNDSTLLYSSNFSTGIALIRRMLRSMNERSLGQFDLGVSEIHHVHKIDAPSGTALDLANDLGIASSEIISQRLGEVKGQHQIDIQSEDESISIRHEVRDRSVFARGALLAATWLVGRQGVFTFDDVFEEQAALPV